jgi:hypothetical protein
MLNRSKNSSEVNDEKNDSVHDIHEDDSIKNIPTFNLNNTGEKKKDENKESFNLKGLPTIKFK